VCCRNISVTENVFSTYLQLAILLCGVFVPGAGCRFNTGWCGEKTNNSKHPALELRRGNKAKRFVLHVVVMHVSIASIL